MPWAVIPWIIVQDGVVVRSDDESKILVGNTLREVYVIIGSNGGELRRIATSWHTCVDQPTQYCAACDTDHDGLKPSGKYEIYLSRPRR
jgi:hypothetical protein